MKKYILLYLTIAFLVCSCTHAQKKEAPTPSTQIPNPFLSFETIEDAEQEAGFDIDLPAIPTNYKIKATRVMIKEIPLIEVIYKEEANEANEIRIRKARTAMNISGDYTSYSEVETLTIDEKIVELSGNNGFLCLATWQKEDYSYSISGHSKDKCLFTQTEILSMVKSLD